MANLFFENIFIWLKFERSLCPFLVIQLCPTFCDPWDVARQAPLSMGFFRQEYWSGVALSCSRGILSTQGSKPSLLGLLLCRLDSLPSEPSGSEDLSLVVRAL